EHADLLAARYPPIGDLYLLWNDTVRAFWERAGLRREVGRVIGQPRSDFFFHPDRWPSKRSLGLDDRKQLLVAFTYDTDAYLKNLERLPDKPWKPMRDDLHAALRAVARERANLEVVVKIHPQAGDLDEVVAEFAAEPLPNLMVMTGAGTANHLIV